MDTLALRHFFDCSDKRGQSLESWKLLTLTDVYPLYACGYTRFFSHVNFNWQTIGKGLKFSRVVSQLLVGLNLPRAEKLPHSSDDQPHAEARREQAAIRRAHRVQRRRLEEHFDRGSN